jgi:Flagellar motor switch protein
MSEALSSSEIDALLNAVSADETLGDSAPAPGASDGSQIRVYDFKRPEPFSHAAMSGLERIYETFGELATRTLSTTLRAPINLRLASIDQLRYEEYTRSIPSPSALAILTMEPLRGNASLEISPGLAFAAIERLLGGTAQRGEDNRDRSDIENALLSSIIVRLLMALRAAWADTLELRFCLSAIESKPQLMRLVAPGEMIALASLETKIGEVEGLLNFCLPYASLAGALERVAERASLRAPEAVQSRGRTISPDEIGSLWLTRYAIFKTAEQGPTASELAAALEKGIKFEPDGFFAYESRKNR